MAEKDQKQGTTAKAKPIGMTSGDRDAFVDLQLQQAAIAADKASRASGTALVPAAKNAVHLARAALGSHSGGAKASKTAMLTYDGAFTNFHDLANALTFSKDAAASKFAGEVEAVMGSMKTHFEPLGWKAPPLAQNASREKVAEEAGATTLTDSEKAALGNLHMRAAREALIGAWEQIVAGDLASLSTATASMGQAHGILINPALVAELGATTDEVIATEAVLSRLITTLEDTPSKLTTLHAFARYLDLIGGLVNRAPQWGTKVGAPAKTATEPVKEPANETDPGAPRAEPAMHRADEIRHFSQRVYLRDYNFEDEELGHIELSFDAVRTPKGQVYIALARATPHLSTDLLTVGADIVSMPARVKGQHYCDIDFLVQVGGPNVTKTESVSMGGKAGADGAEVSIGATFAKSVSTKALDAFQRRYRISPLGFEMNTFDPSVAEKMVKTGMAMTEVESSHRDIEKLVIDGDIASDNLIETDWNIESY